MRKEQKQTKMVLKYHYEQLSRDDKTELRDEFLRQSGSEHPEMAAGIDL